MSKTTLVSMHLIIFAFTFSIITYLYLIVFEVWVPSLSIIMTSNIFTWDSSISFIKWAHFVQNLFGLHLFYLNFRFDWSVAAFIFVGHWYFIGVSTIIISIVFSNSKSFSGHFYVVLDFLLVFQFVNLITFSYSQFF